ncbi:MAG: hypothetical protein FJ100_02330 [Deltaproteobacteria bacterium]|nr:hypothetical protein [Deltaproteobacteria bacterium]
MLDPTPETSKFAGWLSHLAAIGAPAQVAITALVLTAALLPGLGQPGLLDPWEMDRAAVARRMAGPPKVVVVEGPGDKLLVSLSKHLGDRATLVRAAAKADTSPLAALQTAQQRLAREVAHTLVVDAQAVAQQLGGGADELANQLAAIEAQNRGMALVLVQSGPVEPLRKALAQARARSAGASYRNASTAGWIDADGDLQSMWPLLAGAELVVNAAGAAQAVEHATPSPWRWPVHKRDNQNQALPWLDAAMAGASLQLLGPSEFGARLGGALLVLLAGLVVVLGARRLLGPVGGWAALGAFATLPETIGLGRLVTFEAGPMLGTALVALGLGQGALRDEARTGRDWPAWILAGALVLLASRGLGGATMAAGMCVAYAVAASDGRWPILGVAGATLGLLGWAAWRVLGDGDADPNWVHILRGWRFTQNPFSSGPDQYHRDFAWFVGQAGFGVYPWGAAVALGVGRLLLAERDDDRRSFAVGAALLVGLVVPFAVVAVLIRQFHHLVVPVAGVAAVAAAALVVALVRGEVSGRLAALFVVLSTLLLHREIGKGADAVTRFFAFDPPIAAAGATGDPAWPAELKMVRALRAVALLSVVAFAVGTARPFGTLRTVVVALQSRAMAAWALGGVGLLWAIDVLVSIGTKLDVQLKTSAQTTGYAYDRAWVVIQDTRPEVLAAATAFLVLLAHSAAATAWSEQAQAQRWWLRGLRRAGGWLLSRWVAHGLLGVCALATLGSGLSIFTHLNGEAGWAGAVRAGLGSSAFWTPVALAALAGLARTVFARAEHADSLFAPLVRGSRQHAGLLFGTLGWAALAGLGIGASQAAGTWMFPVYLISVWGLLLGVAMLAIGHAQGRAEALAWPTVAVAAFALFVLFGPLAGRWVAEAATPAEGYSYVAQVLAFAPDTAALWVVAAALAANRWIGGHPSAAVLLHRAIGVLGRIEHPRNAALALFAGGAVFAIGYGRLLPDLAVHFSQKHLVQRIADAGGAGNDDRGAPRTYTHGARTGSDNNFYTQSMPLLDDRTAVLSLLANENTAIRLATGVQGNAPRLVALPGWGVDLDKDGNQERDAAGWFGLATAADGDKVTVEGAAFGPGQWKGAAVQAPNGQTATVVDNTKDALTLSAAVALQPEDPARAWLVLDKAAGDGAWRHAAPKPVQRFVVLPKEAFSELNHAMRQNHGGRHIAVMDSSSSRLVLAANFLRAAQPDQNWLRKSLIQPEELNQVRGLRRIQVNFDNALHLVGYKLADAAVQRAQKYRMTLYWKVIKPTPTSWKIFMHPHPLHLDRWPLTQPDPSEDENKSCNGCFATNHWMPGDLIADEFEQEVPLGTNSGPNEIILGLYNPSNDQRMPLLTATGAGVVKHGDNRATIGHLQIR